MVFGSLFLSMPLAIIGNEYDKAWNQVTTYAIHSIILLNMDSMNHLNLTIILNDINPSPHR